MNTTSYKNNMPMIWGIIMFVMGLLYACPDADSSGVNTPTTTLTADDITYDKNRIAQGTADTATLSSSTVSSFSGLTFALSPINTYVGTGTHEPPTIAEDGTIAVATGTSAGPYRVTITPDGITILGNPITVDFYVTIKAMNIGDLDTKLQQAVADYGLTGDFNYIDTSDVTDMSYLFRTGYTPGTGEEDSARTYIEGFNGDISQWDVSSVTDFSYMFYGAGAFSQDLSGWSVDSTDTTTGMFKNSEVALMPDWFVPISITADDITYDKDKIAQGTAGTAILTSSTIADLSLLTFSIAPIRPYVGTGTHEPPTIAEDGTITTATTTSAGSYRVTIAPDGSTALGDSFTVDFYVTVSPADTADLDVKLQQAVADYGLTGDFNFIDTSAVTDLSYLFRSGYVPSTGAADTARTYIAGFNGDISQWDVSSVTDFSYVFQGATVFNQDISGWTVSAGTDFSYMFYGAGAFSQDLSGWSVDSTDTTTGMFKNSGVDPLPAWFVPISITADDVTYDKDSIAQGTVGTATPTSLTIADLSLLAFSIAPISPYVGTGTHEPPTIAEDGTITTATTTSAGSYRVTITPDGSTALGDSFTVDFYVTVKPADTADLDVKLKQAVADYGLTGDFNFIDTSAVTTMSYLFRSGYVPGATTTTADSSRTYIANFNGDISKWDVSSVTSFSNVFYENTAFNQDISKWDVRKGTIFNHMFYKALAFNQNIGGWNVSEGIFFKSMFSGASEFNQNIGGWNVIKGTDFSFMFSSATKFDQNLSDWKVDSTDSTTFMFQNSGMTNLPAWYQP